MNPIDYILSGLEAELTLERELGVRSVEFDRTLLVPVADGGVVAKRETQEAPRMASGNQAGRQSSDQPLVSSDSRTILDYVFLHDRPLSPKGIEMMAKIIQALGKTPETAPVVIVPPIPPAKMLVVLGGLALKKFLPGVKGAPGQWVKDARGKDALVTYSPEYILRFATVTPAVKKIKESMWLSLKSVSQRARMA